MRDFVATAHDGGLAVILDVVYNHLRPAGAYHGQFAESFMMAGGELGGTVSLRDSITLKVRAFCIDKALHWIHEYHLDGCARRSRRSPAAVCNGKKCGANGTRAS